MVNNELERIWKAAVVVQSRYYPTSCLVGQTLVRRAGIPDEIQTEHLTKANTERYHASNIPSK
jgi:hypothetical protein